MPKVSMVTTDERQSLDLSFGDDFEITVRAGDLDQMIRMLGEKRSQMDPPVGTEPPEGETLAPENPRWQVSATASHTMLRIRDPRFGWLRYALSKDEALTLARALSLI